MGRRSSSTETLCNLEKRSRKLEVENPFSCFKNSIDWKINHCYIKDLCLTFIDYDQGVKGFDGHLPLFVELKIESRLTSLRLQISTCPSGEMKFVELQNERI